MVHPFLTKTAILSNGDSVPLLDAAHIHGIISSCLHDSDMEWDVIYYLRELCLGREIEPEERQALKKEGFLTDLGEIKPEVRSVVLSAVRGEGRKLHLESPFTEKYDRVIADYLNAQAELEELEATQDMKTWDAFNASLRGGIKENLGIINSEQDCDDSSTNFRKKIDERRKHPNVGPSSTPPPDSPEPPEERKR